MLAFHSLFSKECLKSSLCFLYHWALMSSSPHIVPREHDQHPEKQSESSRPEWRCPCLVTGRKSTALVLGSTGLAPGCSEDAFLCWSSHYAPLFCVAALRQHKGYMRRMAAGVQSCILQNGAACGSLVALVSRYQVHSCISSVYG